MGLLSTTHVHHHGKDRTVEKLVSYEKTVHEHRAPTDESIRIFNEMQDKAKDSVVAAFSTNNNILEASEVWIIPPGAVDGLEIYVRFKLNGIEYKAKDVISCEDYQAVGGKFHPLAMERGYALLKKSMSEAIAEQILEGKYEFTQTFIGHR